MKRLLITLFTPILMGFITGCEQAPAVIYVDASASSGGNGSAERPLSSLQAGIGAAQPGDIVLVRAGTYEPIRSVRDGTAGARISIIAEDRRSVIVNASGRAADLSHRYLTFGGIVFDGGFGPGQVMRTNGADHLELVDVEIRRGTSNCLALGSVENVLVADSAIHHCVNHFDPTKNADSHGITGTSVFDLTVRNTEISMVTGDALQLSPSRAAWDRIRVEGSRLWSGILEESIHGWPAGEPIGENAVDTKVSPSVLNGRGRPPKIAVIDTIAYGWQGVITNQAAFNVKEFVDATFDRVTVFDSEQAFRLRAPALVRVQNAVVYDVETAFRIEDGLADARILNSTIGSGVTRRAFQIVAGDARELQLKNLLFLGDSVPRAAAKERSNAAQGASGFFDVGGHDYRLAPGSAVIDGGESLPGVESDRDGNARPQGSGHDIGAYESSR